VTETLVARRRRLVRDEIGRIAVDLFVERGFDDVTVDDIAAASGISQRTFFRYFATKDEIVLGFSRRLDRRLVEALDARPAGEGPVRALREAYRETSRIDPDDRARVSKLAGVLARTPELRTRSSGGHVDVADSVTSRVAARMGVPADDQRARVFAVAATAVAAVEFHRWAQGGGRGDLSENLGRVFDLLEAGFADHHPR